MLTKRRRIEVRRVPQKKTDPAHGGCDVVGSGSRKRSRNAHRPPAAKTRRKPPTSRRFQQRWRRPVGFLRARSGEAFVGSGDAQLIQHKGLEGRFGTIVRRMAKQPESANAAFAVDAAFQSLHANAAMRRSEPRIGTGRA